MVCDLITLAACQDDQLAKESQEVGRFKNAFIEALTSDTSASISSLTDKTSSRLKELRIQDQDPLLEFGGANSEILKKIISSKYFKNDNTKQPIAPEPDKERKYKIYSTGKILVDNSSTEVLKYNSKSSRGASDDIAGAWENAYVKYFQSDRKNILSSIPFL